MRTSSVVLGLCLASTTVLGGAQALAYSDITITSEITETDWEAVPPVVVYTVEVSQVGDEPTSYFQCAPDFQRALAVDRVDIDAGTYAGGFWTVDRLEVGQTVTMVVTTHIPIVGDGHLVSMYAQIYGYISSGYFYRVSDDPSTPEPDDPTDVWSTGCAPGNGFAPSCGPVCGDGVQAAGESCDPGVLGRVVSLQLIRRW